MNQFHVNVLNQEGVMVAGFWADKVETRPGHDTKLQEVFLLRGEYVCSLFADSGINWKAIAW